MFIVFKKKSLIFILVAALIFSLGVGTYFAVNSLLPKPAFKVVIDAGHGGVDLGVIGTNTKYPESNINLEMSRLVQKELKRMGAEVVQTRKTEDGLYGDLSHGFKQKDMRVRKETILGAKPDVVVSLHCNKFPDKNRRGVQVFYQKNSEQGKILAELVQTNVNVLNERYVKRSFSALSGDYYVLNCSTYPSIIVECGFLSNPEDEALLLNPDYREELAFLIYCGINSYLTEMRGSSVEK